MQNNVQFYTVLRLRIRDPALFYPWIRDPDPVYIFPDLGSQILHFFGEIFLNYPWSETGIRYLRFSPETQGTRKR
jgi:hypothetical protein